MKKVAIFGASGKIGRILSEKLAADQEWEPLAVIRDELQVDSFATSGIGTVLGDLEGDFAAALEDVDAVVFTAGSGAHTGKDKTLLIDLWGAVRVIRECVKSGPKRFIIVSAQRAGDPDEVSGGIKPYLVAKWAADEELLRSGLDFTILRPGRLLDEAGTGKIEAAEKLSTRHGEISREDVASAILHSLREDKTVGKVVEMVGGDTPIPESF
ncbi:SDR family oxidoreductase [Puniceicoccus vermicola]|uniref:SDR family oxidoreductase n=1 Tax=Puniceicoccus vermicola TaxID=388746 RepID=A0A7X1E425_9BACT|nr:SDR family oxidoreductase [Puniceicoccus vermicola]MBC2600172.1 SDR family oxidoreductase [Puniceicoccus vermicola]